MVTSHIPYIPLSLADAMRGRSAPAAGNSQTAPAFEDQLARTISDSLARMGPNGGQFRVRIEEEGQSSATGAGPRQFLVTVDPISRALAAPEAAPAASSVPLSGPMGSDTQNRRYTDFADPLPALRDSLASLGIDPSSVNFEMVDDQISNWGGHYTNHLIRANMGGRIEDFSLEWTLRNPMVTAVEIRRLMRGA